MVKKLFCKNRRNNRIYIDSNNDNSKSNKINILNNNDVFSQKRNEETYKKFLKQSDGINQDLCFYFTFTPIKKSFFYIFDFVVRDNNEKEIFVKRSNGFHIGLERTRLLEKMSHYKEEYFIIVANKIAELCIKYEAKYDFYHNHIMPFGFQDSEKINKLVDEIIKTKINENKENEK